MGERHQVLTTCKSCHGGCGVIATVEDGVVVHIQGNPDSLTGGTMCSKGLSSIQHIDNPYRIKYPMRRTGPKGSGKWKRITWDEALDRVARLMKDDRDANFVATNADGVTVNRWTTTGFLAASATTNETAFLTYKVVRSAGMLVFDNQARV
jgi:formate dehydrogenase major subunit